MKRVLFASAFLCAFFAIGCAGARAEVEFCPAQLNYKPVAPQTGKAALYGFNLSALGPRTIAAAKLAFDTSAGWFTLDLSPMPLQEKVRHYTGPSDSFTRKDWITPVMYARFPHAVEVTHAFVYNIAVTGDGAFGWQQKGLVTCAPPAAPSAEQLKKIPARKRQEVVLDPKDEDALDAPPSPQSLILAAAQSTALEASDCTEPFRSGTVEEQAQPQYPQVMQDSAFWGDAQTAVEIALNPDGGLAGAWVWAPSGYTPFDDAALRAAKLSRYSGGRAYCKPVPSLYLFRVTFRSN